GGGVEVERAAVGGGVEEGVSRHHQRDAEHESDRELTGELHDPDAGMCRSCCTRGRLCISAGGWRRTSWQRDQAPRSPGSFNVRDTGSARVGPSRELAIVAASTRCGGRSSQMSALNPGTPPRGYSRRSNRATRLAPPECEPSRLCKMQ